MCSVFVGISAEIQQINNVGLAPLMHVFGFVFPTRFARPIVIRAIVALTPVIIAWIVVYRYIHSIP
jgi:hypothetical protein